MAGLYGTREQRKWAATRRAQFALKVALDRIDYALDVIQPELEALGNGTATLLATGNNATDAAAGVENPLQLGWQGQGQ